MTLGFGDLVQSILFVCGLSSSDLSAILFFLVFFSVIDTEMGSFLRLCLPYSGCSLSVKVDPRTFGVDSTLSSPGFMVIDLANLPIDLFNRLALSVC